MAKKRRTKAQIEADLDAVLWHTVKAIAKGHTTGDARARLADGSATGVRLSIEASIDGRAVEQHYAGTLTVGYEESTSSSKTPEEDHLIGLLLSKLPRAIREHLLATLPDHWTEHEALPEVPDEFITQAESLKKKLRLRVPATRRGAVRFNYEPPKAA